MDRDEIKHAMKTFSLMLTLYEVPESDRIGWTDIFDIMIVQEIMSCDCEPMKNRITLISDSGKYVFKFRIATVMMAYKGF